MLSSVIEQAMTLFRTQTTPKNLALLGFSVWKLKQYQQCTVPKLKKCQSLGKGTMIPTNLSHAIDEYSMMSHYQANAKIGVQWQLQGAIAGDHFYYKRERNIVLQLE